jgi:hypothetical protein
MNYVIVYNNSQPQFNINEVHNFITKNLNIIDWWHYLPTVYIVSSKSGINAKDLADPITQRFPGLIFFISQVNLNDHNGVLPKDAWDWINNKIRQVFKLKAIPKPQPLSLVDIFKNTPRTTTPSKLPLTIEELLKAGGYK